MCFLLKHTSSEKSFVICFLLPVFGMYKDPNEDAVNVKDLTVLVYDFLSMIHNCIHAQHVFIMTVSPLAASFKFLQNEKPEIASVGCVYWNKLRSSISL